MQNQEKAPRMSPPLNSYVQRANANHMYSRNISAILHKFIFTENWHLVRYFSICRILQANYSHPPLNVKITHTLEILLEKNIVQCSVTITFVQNGKSFKILASN